MGTSVKEWPVLSPAQAQNFIACHILTIEDVAAMTEEAMARVGMGSRELKEKAREWLSGRDEKAARITALESQLAEALEKIDALTQEDKPRRGRPPKE